MIKISQLKLKIEHTEDELFQLILKALKVKQLEVQHWYIDKQSIDARKKPELYYIYSVCVTLLNEKAILERLDQSKKSKKSNGGNNVSIQIFEPKEYIFETIGSQKLENQPVVIGSGPAGLFCALELAKKGFCPVLLERGAPVEERIKDVKNFWETGVLNTESNVQFGEGGAGTFSDGKLNTGVKDPFGRNRRVLHTLVEHGAPKEILCDSKPHIGTDILVDVVRNIRNHIIELGGCVRFHSKVTSIDIKNQVLVGLIINEKDYIKTEIAVLAIGHSARDTFTYLNDINIQMEAKSFAVGLRVEHPQHMINESQYGDKYAKKLPAAPYKLTANLPSKRGVYSFCMCPGGYVVNASSEIGRLAVNGMSYSKRESVNANSAIVVTVNPEDYRADKISDSVLDGMYYQQDLEQKAYALGKGSIPIQLFGDFCENQSTTEIKSIIPQMKGKYLPTNLRQILPEYISDSIIEGMHIFGRRIQGFSHSDSILSGIETRTSSPVRILRNSDFESKVSGLYPCGEGAGYAGGITSAAIDGIKVFEAIAKKYYRQNMR